jgi:hypothetical protein
MKGIVFTLLQQVVSDEYGESTWDDLLDAADLDGAYTAVATYPDEQMTALVEAASAKLGVSGDEILVWFGRKCIPLFAERYPHVFEGHTSARSLALALNDVIHPEVRKLLPGAYVPEFEYDDSRPDGLSISYSSKRRLCSFAEGLLSGAAEHFGEAVDVTHVRCMKHDDPDCLIDCTFTSAKVG